MSPHKCTALDFPLPGNPSDVDDDGNLPEQPVFNHVKPVTDIEATHLRQESSGKDDEVSRGPPPYLQEALGARLGAGDESTDLRGNTPIQKRDATEYQVDEEIVVRALSEEPPQSKSPRHHTLKPLSLQEHLEVDEPMAETGCRLRRR
jgi:hypothetical protein